jgi:7,8-dihydropterin-6-yl-methyl-4-(beta-D-ribofuranosyl)aminobenzene 5'-phosphate synthase
VIEGIAKFLAGTNTKFYTGHCTGLEAYAYLKRIMGDQIQYLETGTVFQIV